MRSQGVGLADAVDPYDKPKAASVSGLDTRQCVFEDGCLTWLDAQRPRPCQERVGGRLAFQMLAIGNNPVDLPLK